MQLLEGGKGLALMPARHLQLASQHKLLQAIRKSAATNSELVMISSHGLSSEPVLAIQIVPLFVIAVPVAAQPSN